MGIKASKKANITDPPPKDKKLKRKKSKKEEKANNAENGGIEEVGIQQKQSLIEELTKVIHSKENKEEGKLDNGTTASAATEENVEAKKAETASAGSTDAPTDIVQDSPDKDTAGVAVISEVLSPSSQTSPIAEEPKIQEQKVESPVTEAAAAPEKEAAPLPVETKPEVPSTLEIKPDISAAEVKSSPLIEKTESPAVVEAKAEPPVTEEKKVETKESPVAVEPKVETPVEAKIETPVEAKVETPVAAQVETPVAEEPKAESPAEKQDTPVAEEPKIQSPIEEQPKVESPVAEKVESPVVEEQKVTTPLAEEPKVATPVAEAPVAEELKEATPVEEIPPEPVSEAVVESPVEESKADSLPSPPESPTASVPELSDVPVPESSDVPELPAVPVPESPVEAVKLEEIKNEVTEMASPDDAKPVLEEPASPAETPVVNDEILAEDAKIESQAPITNGVNGVKHELTNGTVNGDEQGDHTEVATIVWKNGGDQVYVLGDFNQWKEKCILHKQDDVFSTTIKLSKGVYHLKFDVDGIVTVDDSQPTVGLEDIGQVNILKV